MVILKIILVIVGFLAIVYSRSLFYALDDELEDDMTDCLITALLLITGYGLLYMIYWSMRSVLPSSTSGLLYMGIYFIFLFLAYYIRSLVALQQEWDDGRFHLRHKIDVEAKQAKKQKRREKDHNVSNTERF